jgi:hypothetical protein
MKNFKYLKDQSQDLNQNSLCEIHVELVQFIKNQSLLGVCNICGTTLLPCWQNIPKTQHNESYKPYREGSSASALP